MQPFEDWLIISDELSRVRNSSSDNSYVTPLEVKRMRHYSKYPRSPYGVPLNTQTFNPYAYYVDNVPHQRYLDNLKERGYDASSAARPDSGYPWELTSVKLIAPSVSGTYTSKVNPNNFWTYNNMYFRTSSSSVYNMGPFKGHAGPNFIFNKDMNLPSGLDNFAQTAIVRTAPDPSQFDLAQFIGELREGLPKLAINTFQSRAKRAKSAGGDYLNVEFGWKPLLRDIRSAIDVLTKSTSLLNGLPIPGKPMRRAWGVPETYTESSLTGVTANLICGVGTSSTDFNAVWNKANPGKSGSATGINISSYTARVSKVRTVNRWFVGSYTYFLPMGFDAFSYLDRVRLLSNVEFTPDVLWELAPWSWLTDWAFHLGNSLKANQLAVSELLHIHYAYAMEHTVDKTYLDVSNPIVNSSLTGPGLPKYSASTLIRENKKRIKANPFGFTTSGLSGLSPSQIAILAALGLTKT